MSPFNFITNIAQHAKNLATSWFGPGKPIDASAPPDTQPRKLEYHAGYNYNIKPRADEPITFEMLRNLADNLDLLRICIETAKDQVENYDWDIVSIDRKDKSQEAAIKKAKERIKKPDGRLRWKRWIRQLLEDVIVLDAPAVEIRRTRGGDIATFDLVDGATITVKLGVDGRTPVAPDVAYQQILYGLPAVDLTTDDLLYYPRNVRTHKAYGFGNVEQIIMTVNVAIRRQLYLLGFFTEGNIPDTAFGCPADWKAPQIAEFQAYWDSLFEGNQNMKRKGRFIPDGVKPYQLKSPELKQEIDEWLARIICYNLSLPPTPFVKETNRATAETVQAASLADGVKSRKNYIKEFVDILIQDYMGLTGVEFIWVDEEAADPLEKAQVDKIYLDSKVITPDEVRQDLGKEPLTDEQKELLNPPVTEVNPNITGQQSLEPNKIKPADKLKPDKSGQEELEKVEKSEKKKAFKPLPGNTPVLKKAENKLAKIMRAFFVSQAPDIASQVVALYDSIEKPSDEDLSKVIDPLQVVVDQALLDLNFDGWAVVVDDVQPVLDEIAKYSAARALTQVNVTDEAITKLVNENAVSWSRFRSAQMVGMKYENGILVPNPDSKWAITDGTRSYLRSTVKDAVNEGWSTKKLEKAIMENEAFDKERAAKIARTEIAFADVEGRLIGYKESGVVKGKKSILAFGYDDDDECAANAAVGVIPIDKNFPSGHHGPPYHPHCKCDIIPTLVEENQE